MVITFPNGTMYDDEIKNDKMQGRGILTKVDGTKYFGVLEDGQVCGQGIYVDSRGERFVGEYKINNTNEKVTFAKNIFEQGQYILLILWFISRVIPYIMYFLQENL